MADSKISVYIGARDLKKLAEYKHSGDLQMYEGKGFFHRSKWRPRYVVICKVSGSWNFVCFMNHLASKAEVIYAMKEFESVKEYDDATESITGFTLKFEKPLTPLIFSCDTKDSQMIWLEHIRCAIVEAQQFSADSAYASGGSTVSESNRLSKPYHTIDDFSIAETDTSKRADKEIATENVTEKQSNNTSNSVDDSEVNVDDACNDQQKHSYENIRAENHAFHETGRKQSVTNKERKNADTDETAVKLPESSPIQESKHVRMEDLKLSTQDNEDIAQNLTDVKQIYKGEEQTYIQKGIMHNENHDKVLSEMKLKFSKGRFKHSTQSDVSERRGTVSSSGARSLSCSTASSTCKAPKPFAIEESPVTYPANSTLSYIRNGYVLSSSMPPSQFVFVQEGQDHGSLETDAESVLSVREGQDGGSLQTDDKSFLSVHENQDSGSLQTDDKSFLSVHEGQDSGCLQTNNGSEKERATQSVTTQTSVEGRRKLSVSDPNLATSVEGENMTSRLSTRKKRSRSRPAGSKYLESVDKGPESSTLTRSQSVVSKEVQEVQSGTATSGKESQHSSLSMSEASSALDEEPIYENTEYIDFVTAQPNTNDRDVGNNRDSITSRESGSHLNSSSSSNSFSSRDSNVSLKYESLDEGAQPEYENIEVFKRHEYFNAEKKNVKRIMKNTPNGTFLCCPGETTREELCVMTPCGIRLFRVHEQDGKYSLKMCFNPAFPTLDLLLFYYHHNDLPSKDNKYKVKLERGYNSKQV